MHLFTRIFCVLLIAALFVGAPVFGRDGRLLAPTTTTTMQANNHTIDVDCFLPATPGKHPAILLIHGADGMQMLLFKLYYYRFASNLAADGYVVWLPHYFQATDTQKADPAEMARQFLPWMGVLGDATTQMAKQDNVDPDRLGVVGFSLGGTLCLYEAAFDPRFKVASEFFGGVPDRAGENVKRMPPLLILHGDQDNIVPVENAHKLEKIMKDHHFTYDIKIYEGQGHGFTGEAFDDSYQRTLKWLDAVLKPAEKKKD